MDEYQHLRESAEAAWIEDMNRASGRHAHLIDGRIVPQDHTHGSPDPTYPAEPVGATALERAIGIPPRFAVGRFRAGEARREAAALRRRAYKAAVMAEPAEFDRVLAARKRFVPQSWDKALPSLI